MCLNKTIVVIFSRNNSVHTLYICDICDCDFLAIFMFLKFFENTLIFSFFFISWFCWFLSMFVKTNFVLKTFFFKNAISRIAIEFRFNFSFINEFCRCVNWMTIMHSHRLNLNIFLFQFIVELYFFNQNFLKQHYAWSFV